MKKSMKKLAVLGLALCLSVSSSLIAFAGECGIGGEYVIGWNQTSDGQWLYVRDNKLNHYNPYTGEVVNNLVIYDDWCWIDGDNDGVFECYHFNDQHFCDTNKTARDKYTAGTYYVNENGAWSRNGEVVTRKRYDPSKDDYTNYNGMIYGTTNSSMVNTPDAGEVVITREQVNAELKYLYGIEDVSQADSTQMANAVGVARDPESREMTYYWLHHWNE